MPTDRAAILRHAEKLLQQGKLEPAIAEYRRIVDEHPEDWATANTLGDLYVRVGQHDRALEQYVRIADDLQKQGFLPKAAALYKKVLRIHPDDEHALLQAGEIAASQGLLVDANAYLALAAENRSARGDVQGASEIRARIGSLGTRDFNAFHPSAREIELSNEQSAAEAGDTHLAGINAGEALLTNEDTPTAGDSLTAIAALSTEEHGSATTATEWVDVSETHVELNLVDAVAGLEGGSETSGVTEPDIDQIFADLRHRASAGAFEVAEQDYERGVALYGAGQFEDAIRALEAASRAPIQRFRSAALLGRIYRDRNELPQAIEWFERAAGAPAPSSEDAHALFYVLAESLESAGELERALAICLELQAEAGHYRDLSERILRLTRAQA